MLRENEGKVLAGRLGALLNAVTLLPQELWYEEDNYAHDQTFWARAAEKLPKNGLLLFDLGFINYEWFDDLSEKTKFFVTRCKSNAVIQIEQVLQTRAQVHDYLIHLGGAQSFCKYQMRLEPIRKIVEKRDAIC